MAGEEPENNVYRSRGRLSRRRTAFIPLLAHLERNEFRSADQQQSGQTYPNPYQVEHDVLMDAIRNDRPHNETEYAAISTMTAIMGRMASYSGQMITWEDAINSTVSHAPEKYALDATPPVIADENGHYPVAMPGITKVL